MSNKQKYQDIFIESISIDAKKFHENIEYNEIPEWDSIGHMKLISGLEETTSGEIYIDDVLVNNMDPSKRDISMVFQNYALYPQMTVRENMAFGLKIRKFSLDEINQRVT